jgi:hypothetical protein
LFKIRYWSIGVVFERKLIEYSNELKEDQYDRFILEFPANNAMINDGMISSFRHNGNKKLFFIKFNKMKLSKQTRKLFLPVLHFTEYSYVIHFLA